MTHTLSRAFSLAGASVIGRDHSVKRRNCQDAFSFGQLGSAVFGVVSDGCGEGRRSELGAMLTVAVVGEAVRRALVDDVSLGDLPTSALSWLDEAFVGIVEHVAPVGSTSAAEFIREHLLATVVAFVATPERAIAFASGDGIVLADDEVFVLSEDNRPSYPAYTLLGRRAAPRSFELGSVRHIAVGTDGLDRQSLVDLARTNHVDLSRAMRVIQQSGALEDDSAAVIARRIATKVETCATESRPTLLAANASEILQSMLCDIEGL